MGKTDEQTPDSCFMLSATDATSITVTFSAAALRIKSSYVYIIM